MALGKTLDYRSSGGSSFVFNNRIDYISTSPFYYIAVESIDGLYGADLSYESHPIPNAIGEKSGDVFRRGKTITITGKIYARDAASLDNAKYFLYQMLAEKTLRKLVFTPFNYATQLYFNCRPYQDLIIVETVEGYQHRASFTFGLRADDPRSYRLSDNTVFPTFQQ